VKLVCCPIIVKAIYGLIMSSRHCPSDRCRAGPPETSVGLANPGSAGEKQSQIHPPSREVSRSDGGCDSDILSKISGTKWLHPPSDRRRAGVGQARPSADG